MFAYLMFAYPSVSDERIKQGMRKLINGEPPRKGPAAAFIWSHRAPETKRIWIVSQNFFGHGRSRTDMARTLVREATHSTSTIDDPNNKKVIGFHDAPRFSKWIVMRPLETR
ncbi:MAG: hypothetical protein OQK04_18245 [Kangiellaceae bacterium]|nr:hypothetical protein [Kangiellaceae bacterium]MCW9000657.1 hypothetical protein [Kangiellaceae bacterium]